MSLAYPLARTADDALTGAGQAARTRYDAEALAGDTPVLSLETEWIKPDADALPALLKQAEAGEAKGFIQTYEDADGQPVLAVTYWKLGKAAKTSAPKPAAEAKPDKPKPAKKQKTEEDHTDDLYFRHTKGRKPRKKPVDPRQMDLFLSPDARGYESKDPNNPNTMLTEEEGDGTTFGG
ncbi:hypothetical protein [Henriciella aquimarina]|uniref:hypothetical protein n=1 Tax=Henriciella aquimarina TaxID=545261 RepID=UPI000A01C29C|nr:hypothetical protein [Henriciella aquimarina]